MNDIFLDLPLIYGVISLMGIVQVQAVLLLLGGYEVPAGAPTMGIPPQNQRVQVQHIVLAGLDF